MRRLDRQIKDMSEIRAILDKADVCRVAMADGSTPYLVAMNFGFQWEEALPGLYFHCAPEGRKLGILAKNPEVCFQMDTDHEIVRGDKGCSWGMKYKSVVGYGRLTEVTDPGERLLGLNLIMRHYGAQGPQDYAPEMLKKTKVLKLAVTELTGKKKS